MVYACIYLSSHFSQNCFVTLCLLDSSIDILFFVYSIAFFKNLYYWQETEEIELIFYTDLYPVKLQYLHIKIIHLQVILQF